MVIEWWVDGLWILEHMEFLYQKNYNLWSYLFDQLNIVCI